MSQLDNSVDKLRPYDDPRFTHEYATLNGRRYHYLLALPEGGKFTRTVFLIHGWPDLSLGWRYQVPMFLSMGCRVVCPDNMGTEAPHVPPEPQNVYGLKRCADDIAELARQLGAGQIILGGHDWGGAVVYRVCLWHPELVSHLFVVCTPYLRPSAAKGDDAEYTPLDELVRTRLPFWQYQLQLGSGVVQEHITQREHFESFIRGMFGGQGAGGEAIFDVYKGVLFENLGKIGPSPLMDADETRYYVDEFYRNGMAGNVNWYKTHRSNFDDERALAGRPTTIDIPTLFIMASRDLALPPALGAGMDEAIPQLRRAEVDGTHWVLWQKPAECNKLIKDWIDDTKALSEKSSL